MNMQKNTYKDIIFRGIGTLVFCILYFMVLKGCRTIFYSFRRSYRLCGSPLFNTIQK